VVMVFLFFILTIRHREKMGEVNVYLDKLKQAKLFKLSKANDAQYQNPKGKKFTIKTSNIYPLN
jgi:hypothetical protein